MEQTADAIAVRPAVKAGTWYAGDRAGLQRELDGYLAAVPENYGGSPIVAGVVPHAGLTFSGAVTARTYAALRQSRPDVETIVICGAVHTAFLERPALWPRGVWTTPLGNTAVDTEIAETVLDAGLAVDAPAPHYNDNAIELQLPFIQYLFPQARIVPIAMPPLADAAEIGTALAALLLRQPRSAVVLASTDLTHYGRNYGFAPAENGENALSWAKANDERLLAAAQNLEAERIVPLAESDRSACGAGALAAAVAYARAAGSVCGELLVHTNSYEVMPVGRPEMFVGYAAMVFRGRSSSHP